MNAITFDTLKFARTLRVQGTFTPEQSSCLAEALGGALATKGDTRGSEPRLEVKVVEIEAKTRVAIAKSKVEMLRWMTFGMVGFQALIILEAAMILSKSPL